MAGSEGLTKRLFKGDTATFDGTLLNDNALRDINIDSLNGEICEKKLLESSSFVDHQFPEIGSFLFGAIISGIIVYTVTEHKDLIGLSRNNQMHMILGIRL